MSVCSATFYENVGGACVSADTASHIQAEISKRCFWSTSEVVLHSSAGLVLSYFFWRLAILIKKTIRRSFDVGIEHVRSI